MLLASLVLLLDTPQLPSPAQARGVVYALLREHAPELHDQQSLKPFTVSVGPQRPPFLRLTFLNDDLYARLSPHLYPLAGRSVRFGATSARVTAVLQEGHPWAALSTYGRLFQGDSQGDVSLRFATPTFFRRQGQNYALPEPGLVFGSLLSRWNAYAPLPVPAELEQALPQLTFKYFNLRTRTIAGHTPTAGALGRATYHLPGASEEQRRWLSALGRFAFYSGVGAKTTLGFGQVRPYTLRLKS